MRNCLTTIIGLTDRDCNCYEDSRPEGYDVSDSGYYLTDPEHGIELMQGLFETADCGEGSIWDILTKARSTALLDFEADLTATIYSSYAQRFSGFSGVIGNANHSSTIFNTSAAMGQRWVSRGHRGSTAAVKRIGLGLNVAAAVEVKVLDSAFSEVASVVVNTVANQIVYVDIEPIVLNLHNDSDRHGQSTYYFAYDLPTGARPLNNTVTCCGKKPTWQQYMDVNGVRGATAQNMSIANGDCNGLSVDCFIKCSPLSWVCNSDVLEGFQINLVVARTVQFRAAAKLIQKILDSPATNYYTVMNREALYGKRNHLNKRYEENIQWLAANAPLTETDCLKCRDNRLKKASILV